MKVRLLKAGKVKELLEHVPENLSLYREGNFNSLSSDGGHYIEIDLNVDITKLAVVQCDATNTNEAKNSKLVFEAFPSLSKYLARDERFWVYLCHTHLLSYARNRWPIPEDDTLAIKHIRDHFFVAGARGFERLNAASRLWWMAMLCHRAQGLTFDEALECFLHNNDVRANIIERPTTSQSVEVFSAILKRFHESYKSDKKLYVREKYRAAMKDLNLLGGVTLLGTVQEATIHSVLDKYSS